MSLRSRIQSPLTRTLPSEYQRSIPVYRESPPFIPELAASQSPRKSRKRRTPRTLKLRTSPSMGRRVKTLTWKILSNLTTEMMKKQTPLNNNRKNRRSKQAVTRTPLKTFECEINISVVPNIISLFFTKFLSIIILN